MTLVDEPSFASPPAPAPAVAAAPRPAPLSHQEEGLGPAVVLVHGQPGTAHDWRRVTERLTAASQPVRIIAPDRPGYGRTGGKAASIAENADAIAELLDRQGVGRAVVAGHSLGGAIALSLAQRHPEKVAALVLAAPVGGPSALDAVDKVLALPKLGRLLTFAGFRAAARAVQVRPVRDLVARIANTDPDDLETSVRAWPRSWRAFADEQERLAVDLPEIADGLADVKVPVTVVGGDRDPIVSPRHVEEVVAALPDATLVPVAKARHLLPHEAPGVLADAILEAVVRDSDLASDPTRVIDLR